MFPEHPISAVSRHTHLALSASTFVKSIQKQRPLKFGGGEDIFIHFSYLDESLKKEDGSTKLNPKDIVTFEIGMTDRGRVAFNVKRVYGKNARD